MRDAFKKSPAASASGAGGQTSFDHRHNFVAIFAISVGETSRLAFTGRFKQYHADVADAFRQRLFEPKHQGNRTNQKEQNSEGSTPNRQKSRTVRVFVIAKADCPDAASKGNKQEWKTEGRGWVFRLECEHSPDEHYRRTGEKQIAPFVFSDNPSESELVADAAC